MSELAPCPECQRHVRKDETCCPFCGQALSLSQLPARVLPRSRLGRAATFAFGATLASATLSGCGGDSERKKAGEGGAASGGVTASGGNDAGESGGGADVITPVVPPYGAPTAETDAGGAGGIGSVEVVGGAPAAGSGVGGGFIGIPK